MKVKQLRLKLQLSLRELSDMTELSISYLNEIEKGKKYPKPEKLVVLAESLGVAYDDLVSTHLDDELNPLSEVLDSALIQKFPLDLFGITPNDVLQLLSQAPREAGALARTVVDITRNYDMGIENFFHAALRSFQELHANHFPEIELEAASFRKRTGELHTWHACSTALTELTGAEVTWLPEETSFQKLRSIWVPGSKPCLFLNRMLLDNQKAFVIAREIGYRVLGLDQRALTSPPIEVQTFDQVLNDFKASYFAGALLIDRLKLSKAMREFFSHDHWDAAMFSHLMHQFHATPEMFFYRLSQVLPEENGLERIHFLRFTSKDQSYYLTKELNMSDVGIPSGISLNEHFCRRWLSLQVIDLHRGGQTAPDIQISRFLDKPTQFLCISVARALVLQPDTWSSVTLGFQLDGATRRRIAFHNDKNIQQRVLGQTCERCPLSEEECTQRVAPPTKLNHRNRLIAQRRAVQEFLEKNRRPN